MCDGSQKRHDKTEIKLSIGEPQQQKRGDKLKNWVKVLFWILNFREQVNLKFKLNFKFHTFGDFPFFPVSEQFISRSLAAIISEAKTRPCHVNLETNRPIGA